MFTLFFQLLQAIPISAATYIGTLIIAGIAFIILVVTMTYKALK